MFYKLFLKTQKLQMVTGNIFCCSDNPFVCFFFQARKSKTDIFNRNGKKRFQRRSHLKNRKKKKNTQTQLQGLEDEEKKTMSSFICCLVLTPLQCCLSLLNSLQMFWSVAFGCLCSYKQSYECQEQHGQPRNIAAACINGVLNPPNT